MPQICETYSIRLSLGSWPGSFSDAPERDHHVLTKKGHTSQFPKHKKASKGFPAAALYLRKLE